MSRAAQLANRVALIGCGLFILLLLPGPATAGAGGSGAGISIVKGQATSIKEWPWQVALVHSTRMRPKPPATRRYFCGGSVLAPRLVVTAAHCVADLNRSRVRGIEVVSGRTRLNSNQGQVVRVAALHMPRDANGKRRYKALDGSANWDVALLRLASPLTATPIKLAGPDEGATWTSGQPAWTTGWGVTQAFARRAAPGLRLARQVIMPDGLCRRAGGNAFSARTMVCAGGPGGNASACNGDSGGPLVVDSSDGYRLVGVTSFGDGACRGAVPSVDTRVSGEPIRSWIAQTAMKLTGVDVVGSGGLANPVPQWCRVPAVFGLRPAQARQRLLAGGCRLGKVRTDRWAAGPRGRIIGYSRFPGWLAPIGFGVDVWLAP